MLARSFVEESVMRKTVYKNTLFIVLLFAFGAGEAQKKFDLSVNGIVFNIDGKKLNGYETSFDFDREEVRKGWWRYVRAFGTPMDMRSYYLAKIPAQSTDGNIDLTIYAQTKGETVPVEFKIGIESDKYKAQVEELIKVFKKDFYIQYYLAKLRVKEQEAGRIASEYASSESDVDKEKLLTTLNAKKEQVDWLKEEIRKIESQ